MDVLPLLLLDDEGRPPPWLVVVVPKSISTVSGSIVPMTADAFNAPEAFVRMTKGPRKTTLGSSSMFDPRSITVAGYAPGTFAGPKEVKLGVIAVTDGVGTPPGG